MGRRLWGLAVGVVAVLLVAMTAAGAASVVARVDLSTQTMQVTVDGETVYTWPVSTARRGYVTPTGTYRPTRLHRKWYSRKYDNAPMPHSIFFRGGYAIHGTTAVRSLGRAASHGCIRLHPENAATLFRIVRSHGSQNTRIVISR